LCDFFTNFEFLYRFVSFFLSHLGV